MLPLCYRLSMQNPQRAISALSLLITCMYTGRKLSDFFSWHGAFLEDLLVFCILQAKLATDRVESTLSLTLWSFQQKTYSSLLWSVSRFFLTGWFNIDLGQPKSVAPGPGCSELDEVNPAKGRILI